MLQVPRPVPLCPLHLGRLGERDGAEPSLVEGGSQFLDDASLAGGVTPFEDDQDLEPLVLDPELPADELDLKLF